MNNLTNFAEKNILNAQAKGQMYRNAIDEGIKSLSQISGLPTEELNSVVEKVKAVEDINTLTEKDIEELLGSKANDSLNEHLKNIALAKRLQYKRDFLDLLVEFHEMEIGVDGSIKKLEEDNKEFQEKMDKLIKAISDSALSVEENLRQLMEKDPSQKENAETMIKALHDVSDLTFLKTNNLKRLVDTVNNIKKHSAVKNKALKILINNDMAGDVQFNTFEVAIASFIMNDKDLVGMPPELQSKVVVLITTQFFIFISKTKRVDLYKKSYITYFKLFLQSLPEEQQLISVDNLKFKTNLKNYILKITKGRF